MDDKTARALGMKSSGGSGGRNSGKGKLQGQTPAGGTGKPNATPVGGTRPMATGGKGGKKGKRGK